MGDFSFISKMAFRLSILLTALMIGGCSSRLYYPSRGLYSDYKMLRIDPPENISFPSQDGKPLHGWYFRNKSRRTPKALVVFFHGNAGNVSSQFQPLYWLLGEGYDFMVFDYQGFGLSEGKPSPKRTVEDGVAALCWSFLKYPDIPLVVYGQSLGGAVALRTVVEVKGAIPVQFVVVESTFASYRAAASSVMAQFWFAWPFLWLPTVAMSDRYAPRDRIGEISPIPLLVFHGQHDRGIPPRLGLEIFRLAREPKEFVLVPRGLHTDAFWRQGGRYRRLFLDRVKKWTAGHHPVGGRERQKAQEFCTGTNP